MHVCREKSGTTNTLLMTIGALLIEMEPYSVCGNFIGVHNTYNFYILY